MVSVSCNIEHQLVTSGQCVCLNGDGVNARDKPGMNNTRVVATFNTSKCFILNGHNVTCGNYRWFERMWIAGYFLVQATGCGESRSWCHSCQSRHYLGQAVTLGKDARADNYIRTCSNMGGWGSEEDQQVICQF
ncbi:hypothetical protein BaRGS_00013059 [Batillaria attramentaria]|uniref:Cyanovirin-N domain-containing protein n=1 Tax=Batillaria attramentaria TaxID=370345 RepID=A0ABD0L8Y2_9CAEN